MMRVAARPRKPCGKERAQILELMMPPVLPQPGCLRVTCHWFGFGKLRRANDTIGRLPLGIKFPMPRGKDIRRVENRSLEEALVHAPSPLSSLLLSHRPWGHDGMPLIPSERQQQ